MRKIIAILLVVVLVAAIAAPAMAVEPRLTTITPTINFGDDVATCAVSIVGNTMDEKLVAVIRLYQDRTLIARWDVEGDGYIFFSRTKAITPGHTYKLTVNLTVDGVACSQVYVDGDY